jgi:NADH dehydrogenase
MKNKTKILILGGGFGGLYTYLNLKRHFNCNDIEVTIINRTNYFLFTPMLHEVATGGLAHHQVVESIRQVIYKSKANLLVAEIELINPKDQIVKTSKGDIEYDFLVVATGSTANFFNIKGAEEHTLTLKDLEDAIKMRENFINTFENASTIKSRDMRKEELSFAFIGGGPTGVELAAETAELFLKTFSKYYKNIIDPKDISIYLINKSPEILGMFHPILRNKALKVLESKGVKVMANTGVKEVTNDGVILDNDTTLKAKHTVWTAGVCANTPKFTTDLATDTAGRIYVNPFLQMKEYINIFVMGDVACCLDKDGRPLPMLAQVAVAQGKIVAKNIKSLIADKKLDAFVYKPQGELVSLGHGQAVANIMGIRFYGRFAWFLWRTIYLFKFISGAKKLKIALDWTINIFYPRDITKS